MSLGGLFGGGKAQSVQPSQVLQPFNFGGVKGFWGPDGFTINSTGEKNALLDQLKQGFLEQADILQNQFNPQFQAALSGQESDLESLLAQFTPGFGKLTEATKNIFQRAQEKLGQNKAAGISDLADNLARRKILGSSFASDAVSRREAEFDQLIGDLSAQEQQTQAQTSLQELAITQELLTQKAGIQKQKVVSNLESLTAAIQARQAASSVDLGEFDKILQIGSNLLGQSISSFASIAQQQQQLAAESAGGFGKFLGNMFGDSGGSLDFGKIFGGGGGGSSSDWINIVTQLAAAYASSGSDRRFKRCIQKIGEKLGYAIYRFKYLWSDNEYEGVMADEVPDYAKINIFGFDFVDYSKLGLEMRAV